MNFFYRLLILIILPIFSQGQCPVINSAMINACATPPSTSEGINEFVLFTTTAAATAGSYTLSYGSSNPPATGLPVNNLAGSNARTKNGIGNITSTNGCIINQVTSAAAVIPVNSQVIFVPSNFDTDYDVTAICTSGKVYVVYIDITKAPSSNWNPSGTFANSSGTSKRYLQVSNGAANCNAGVRAYNEGWSSSADGNAVWWDAAGNPLYENKGCSIIAPPAPTITPAPITAVCQGITSATLTFTTTNNPDKYSITWDAAAIAAGFINVIAATLPVSPLTINIPAAIAAATYTGSLLVTNSISGLSSTAQNISITINPIVTPVTGFSYNVVSACINGSNPLLQPDPGFTTGGTFTVAPIGLSIDPSTGAINIATSTADNYTITYTVPANGCSPQGSSQFAFSVYNNITPVTGFNYTPNTVCANGVNPLLVKDPGFASGGSYSATPAGLSINAATGDINVAASTAGIYTIKYDVAASGCTLAGSGTASFTITANTNPVTGFSYTPNNICANGSDPTLNTIAGFTTGGTYSALPAGLSINTATGAINAAASTPGNYTITYAIAATGCALAGSSTASFAINANTIPVTGFNYTPNNICANGSNPTLNTIAGFTTGGTYSALPAGLSINTATGAINAAASMPGNYTITYAVAATGCALAGSSTASFTINANTNPVTAFNYTPDIICANGNNPTLNTVAGFTTGGTYSASPAGLSINAATGAINVVASSPGVYTVTYSIAAAGCALASSNSASFTINANINPVTTFNYVPNSICTNGSDPTLNTIAGFTTGGSYSASPAGLTINAATGAINIGSSMAGNYNIIYTVIASGCTLSGSGTSMILINTTIIPVTTFSYIPNSLCANGVNPTLNTITGFATGGTFSATPAGLSINAVSGAINMAASSPGNYTVNYSIAASGCSAAASGTATFTIIPTINPATGFSYAPNSICANGNNPSLNTINGFTPGGIYSASPSGLSINSNTGSIDAAASNAGNYTITYTLSATGCTLAGSNTSSFTINSNSTPVTGISYSPNTICVNGSNPSLNAATGFTAGGIFTATPAGLNINAATGAVNIAASNAGVYTITYTVAASGCSLAGLGNTSITISSSITPVTKFNYSPNEVCANGNNPVLSTDPLFTTGGVFSATTLGVSLNAATGAINVAASQAGVYAISYTIAVSGCTLAGSSLNSFTINPLPAAAVTQFSYASPVCANGTSAAPVKANGFTNGGIFSSTNGLAIDAITGTINLTTSTPGIYTVIYTIAATNCAAIQTGAASINILNTVPPAVVNNDICGPGIVTLTAITNSPGIINWYNDAALFNLVNTGNTFSPTLTNTSVYFVTATDAGCTSSPASITASIKTIPPAPSIKDSFICSGERITLDAGPFAKYTWQDGSGNRTFNVTTPGEYSVEVSNSEGCSNSKSISVRLTSNCSDIYFPSAITPDGNGRNDYFGPLPFSSLSSIKNYSLVIYNRYGQIVFNTNDPLARWDGKFKGAKYINTNYVWYSSYLYRGSILKKQKGNILVIR